MTKRKMFLRMITASLLRRRSRMLIALLSIAVGATILSGLVTIYIDVPRQMGAQFRSYGANMILLPKEGKALTVDRFQKALEMIPGADIVGATPYRYVRLDMPSRQQSFISAGTDFSQVQKTSPYFSVEGEYPKDTREVLVGKEIAQTLGVKAGSSIELSYKCADASGQNSSSGSRGSGEALHGSAEGFNKVIVSADVILDDEGKIASLEVDASSQTPERHRRFLFRTRCLMRTQPLVRVQSLMRTVPKQEMKGKQESLRRQFPKAELMRLTLSPEQPSPPGRLSMRSTVLPRRKERVWLKTRSSSQWQGSFPQAARKKAISI